MLIYEKRLSTKIITSKIKRPRFLAVRKEKFIPIKPGSLGCFTANYL